MLISAIMSSPHPSPPILPPITSFPWPADTSAPSVPSSTGATVSTSPATRPTVTIAQSRPISPKVAIMTGTPLLPISPRSPPSAAAGQSDRQRPLIHRSPGSLSPEAILAEKRRRNAGASSRFRERRKQRERELQERVVFLENKVQLLESALRAYDPRHPQLSTSSGKQHGCTLQSSLLSAGRSGSLSDRLSQLEIDVAKLSALENENQYLKSLLDSPAQH
ncbi:hypothetical protein BX666DRAFT_1310943 [Dichotomocladium elegans]|nr:hypothetical protein BX666DRAFT_1310943 [Dichotomocladium elegans]